jgi:hypothetical protein
MDSALLTAILIIINVIVGALLLTGKLKLVVAYKDEEQPAPWPQREEPADEEPVANYVKPVEEEEKPAQKVAPKRRSRPTRTTKQRPPATPAV